MSSLHGTTIQLDVPASHRWLNVVGSCAVEMLSRVESIADRETVIYSTHLAIHETCANIIDHAYPGKPNERIVITLTLLDEPLRLMIDLRDTGRSFNIEQVLEPNLNVPQVHGYGLFLVRNLVDDVSYTPLPSGNHWCLIKHL